MKPLGGTKKLTLHKESLRRLTRELTEPQLVKVLGGTDAGPNRQATNTLTFQTSRICPDP